MPIKSRNDLSPGQKSIFYALFSERFSFKFLELQLILLGQNEVVQNGLAEYYADKYIGLCRKLMSSDNTLTDDEKKSLNLLESKPGELEYLLSRSDISEKIYLFEILRNAKTKFTLRDNQEEFWGYLKDYFKRSLLLSYDPEIIRTAFYFKAMAARFYEAVRYKRVHSKKTTSFFLLGEIENIKKEWSELPAGIYPDHFILTAELASLTRRFGKGIFKLTYKAWLLSALTYTIGSLLLLGLMYKYFANALTGSQLLIGVAVTALGFLALSLHHGLEPRVATKEAEKYLQLFRETYTFIETQFKDPVTGKKVETHVAGPTRVYQYERYEGPAAPSYTIGRRPTQEVLPHREGPKIKRRGVAANQAVAQVAQSTQTAFIFANGIRSDKATVLDSDKKIYGYLNEHALERAGVNALSIKHFSDVLTKAKFAQASNDSGIKLVKGSPFMRTPEGIRPVPYKLKIIASGVDSGARVFGHLVEGKNAEKLIMFDTYTSGKKAHQSHRVSARAGEEYAL
ncbi:MAG: hypothetical protein K0R66_502 [Gammaproteobacteria bacterium]|jgi:hypothetical protein|nr:hypothetical protein [Gammaproteobacteria bacterium]